MRTAAAAVIDVVNHAMAEVLKIVSVQRGHDPREFVLAAFGGAGPLHAAALADELGIAEVICPPIPGAFSALGLIGTDLKRDYVQTLYVTTDTADPAALEAAFAALEREGAAMLDRAGVAPERRRFERSVDARYARQSYELVDACSAAPARCGGARRDRRDLSRSSPAKPTATTTAASRCRSSACASPRSARSRRCWSATRRRRAGTDAVKSKRQLWFRETGAVDATIYDRQANAAGARGARVRS